MRTQVRHLRFSAAAFASLALCWLVAERTGATAPRPAVAMIEPEGEAQRYWPRWRGPSGQGLAAGTGYPDAWSRTENVAWRTPVPGRGHSSPIVWDDRIFLTTAYPDGRASMLAYERSNGKQRWEAFVPDRTPEHTHRKNSHASPTPVTDGRRIYASFGNRGLVAFDFDGKLIWHHSLGTFDNYHGTAGSPLLYQDRLILYQDHDGGSEGGAFVAAFATSTGERLWRTEREATVGWGTPVAIRAGNRDEIIVSGQRRVVAYDPASGRELWRASGNTREVIPTPVVGHGLVFCSSGRAGPTLAIRPGGAGDITDTHVVWQSPKGSPFVPSPLLYGERLYIVNDMASIATSLEATTGKVVWQGRLGIAKREGFSASPVGVDGKVFFTNDDGETFVLRAGPEFELIRVNRLEARLLASPALVDGHWYFRTEQDLIAIGE
ncbi:MAG: PQQ-binding-like beta-propeller repeat protein [Luteitalea sp.]|nr:PQQ-binding-like beta-propeller repeat protein [Luteitalea sp.]